MRYTRTLCLGSVALLMAGFSVTHGQTATDGENSSESQITQLTRKLAETTAENKSLTDQNRALEQHLLEMGKTISQLQGQIKLLPDKIVVPPMQAPPPLPPLPPDDRRLPDGWRQRQFEGLPFYVIPL